MKYKDYLGNDVHYGDTVVCATKNRSGGYSPTLTKIIVTRENYDGVTLDVGSHCDSRKTTNIINITSLISDKTAKA